MKTVDLNAYFDRAADLAIARSRELGRPLSRRDRIAFALFLRTINGLEQLTENR